jgi:hypothetical protein
MPKEKSFTKVAVESVDIKEFRALMAKHKIKITSEDSIQGKSVFTLNENEDRLEDILVATNFVWDFYWK